MYPAVNRGPQARSRTAPVKLTGVVCLCRIRMVDDLIVYALDNPLQTAISSYSKRWSCGPAVQFGTDQAASQHPQFQHQRRRSKWDAYLKL